MQLATVASEANDEALRDDVMAGGLRQTRKRTIRRGNASDRTVAELKADVAALKQQCDIVISSHHWGYAEEILQYQKELAHAAIDAGADIIMGHGPHFPLAIEFYKSRPIYYGLGMCCFIRSNKKVHRGWTGMSAHLTFEGSRCARAAFSIVRQNDASEVLFSPASVEAEAIARVARLSAEFGTTLEADGDVVKVN